MNDRNRKKPGNAGRDQIGRFKRGVSGNAGGRPKGALNRTTRAAMALLEGEAEMLTRRAVDAARDGDISALKLVLDRIIPPRRRPMVQIDLDELYEIGDSVAAHRRIIQGALDGGMSLDEAERLSKLVLEHLDAWDIGVLEYRAQRYIGALFHELFVNRRADRNSATRNTESESQILEAIKVPDDLSLAKTLIVAAMAYTRDGFRIGFKQAWSALPAFEQERIREVARYFPVLVDIPEDKEDEDDLEEVEDEDEGI
jgi:hypothetical protein